MTDEEFSIAWDFMASPKLKEVALKLRHMGKQYAAGQYARGGRQQKHYLEEAADELERLFKESMKHASEAADLRNVVQAACIGGLPSMADAWSKYFPDHPITIAGVASGSTVASKPVTGAPE